MAEYVLVLDLPYWLFFHICQIDGGFFSRSWMTMESWLPGSTREDYFLGSRIFIGPPLNCGWTAAELRSHTWDFKTWVYGWVFRFFQIFEPAPNTWVIQNCDVWATATEPWCFAPFLLEDTHRRLSTEGAQAGTQDRWVDLLGFMFCFKA